MNHDEVMIYPTILANLRKGKSLRTDFMFSLLLAMIPAFLISLSFDYYFVYTENMKALREVSENKVSKAVHTLQKPLWHYDTDFLQNYVEILADDSSLTRVVVHDERGKVVAQIDKSSGQGSRRSISWEMEQPIVQEGVTIGRLQVSFNNSEISRLTGQMILSDILVILAVLCSVWSVTWILIMRYVLHPLKIMKDSFHGISEGDYSRRVLLENNNELTSIATEFNAMVDQVEMREMTLRKYKQMVSSITDSMLLIDRDFIIQAVNNAYLEITGKERQQLIGSHILAIYDEQVFQEDFQPYFEACLEGTTVKNELLMTGDDTKAKYMVITYYPIFEQDNSVSGVMMHQRDVTEQKKLEAMLHQSQKMEAIGTLAGGIAHDFNNIIGGIIGYAEMIEMFDAQASPRIEARIQHVLKGAYRAKDLIEQILTFSRNSDSKKKPLNLGALVKDTMQFLRASIPSTIEIVKQEIHAKAVVWADETSIHQILMNLCTNAAHAMQQDGGELFVSLSIENLDSEAAERINVSEAGPYVVLSVRDSGVGIDPSKISRIFEPFYTTKKTGEGTGMGLAVVHGIVKNLRGAITVESTPGLGSTFSVYLPQFDFSDKETEESRPVHDAIPEGKGCILIVDDEEELVNFSKEILEHLGYEVVSKTSSVNARKTFMEDPDRFDLVITDQTMPNITGLDLAKQFLEIRGDLHIILCTGFSQPNIEQEANALGIHRFVKKPFGARQLAGMVREELSFLRHSRKNNGIIEQNAEGLDN